MLSFRIFAATAAVLVSAPAIAQDVKVASESPDGRVCAAHVANQAGIFKKNGLEVRSRRSAEGPASAMPQGHPVRATTVETGFPECQWRSQPKRSSSSQGTRRWHGKRETTGLDQGSEGQTVAASAPGTAPYFTLAWMLKKNGLSVKDVTVVNLEPAAAAQAFVAGQNDAAMTYEPYLSTVRAAPDKGKIIATTLDYPMIMDTFGCTPKFLTDNPKAAQALADSYFEAVALIEKDQAKSYEIMGSDVKQSGEQFGNSAKYLRWQDKAANQKFFAGEFQAFTKEAASAARDRYHQVDIRQSMTSVTELHPVFGRRRQSPSPREERTPYQRTAGRNCLVIRPP